MTAEAYLMRYFLLCRAVEKDEKAQALLASAPYLSFVERFGDSRDPALASAVQSREKLRRAAARKKRLAERYAARIARAIAAIDSPELREYALCHYLYGMTHEAIAEQSFFSVRTVYRQAKKAKEELKKALLSAGPKIKKCPPHRFRIRGALPRRPHTADLLPPSLAAHYARKRGYSSFQRISI